MSTSHHYSDQEGLLQQFAAAADETVPGAAGVSVQAAHQAIQRATGAQQSLQAHTQQASKTASAQGASSGQPPRSLGSQLPHSSHGMQQSHGYPDPSQHATAHQNGHVAMSSGPGMVGDHVAHSGHHIANHRPPQQPPQQQHGVYSARQHVQSGDGTHERVSGQQAAHHDGAQQTGPAGPQAHHTQQQQSGPDGARSQAQQHGEGVPGNGGGGAGHVSIHGATAHQEGNSGRVDGRVGGGGGGVGAGGSTGMGAGVVGHEQTRADGRSGPGEVGAGGGATGVPPKKSSRLPGTKVCPGCDNTIAAALARCSKCPHVFREKKEKVKRSGKRGKKTCPKCSFENPSACSSCKQCNHVFRLKLMDKYRSIREQRQHALQTGAAQAHVQVAAAAAAAQQQQQSPNSAVAAAVALGGGGASGTGAPSHQVTASSIGFMPNHASLQHNMTQNQSHHHIGNVMPQHPSNLPMGQIASHQMQHGGIGMGPPLDQIGVSGGHHQTMLQQQQQQQQQQQPQHPQQQASQQAQMQAHHGHQTQQGHGGHHHSQHSGHQAQNAHMGNPDPSTHAVDAARVV